MIVTIKLTQEEHIALSAAVLSGAFAARNKQLTSLMDLDAPSQRSDTYEREIHSLQRAADAIVRGEPS